MPKVFSTAFSRAFTGQIVRRKDPIAADGLLNRNLKSETKLTTVNTELMLHTPPSFIYSFLMTQNRERVYLVRQKRST